MNVVNSIDTFSCLKANQILCSYLYRVYVANSQMYQMAGAHFRHLIFVITDQKFGFLLCHIFDFYVQVNGDTVYMTGNFKKFKMDDPSNSTWDEQNALSSTAVCSFLCSRAFGVLVHDLNFISSLQDYLASIDSSQPNSSFK